MKQKNDGYISETIFHLPGAFLHFKIYDMLFKIIEENVDVLKENVKIGSVYDSPGCIWNGGRVITGITATEELYATLNAIHAPIRFTFTNCLLEEKHLQDSYCNLLLEIFNNGNNEIICNSKILEEYIRNKYKNNYKYISSTTKRLIDKNKQLAEINKDNYHLVVLDYDYNQDFDFLNNIKNKEKCEILCNPVCKPNCPFRQEHYKIISQDQLNYAITNYFQCPFGDSGKWFWQIKNRKNIITPKKINDIYLPMGFKNFKLEGRTTHSLDLIEILIFYLIKEEFALEVRAKLQMAIW